jgi:hypothetical protein
LLSKAAVPFSADERIIEIRSCAIRDLVDSLNGVLKGLAGR